MRSKGGYQFLEQQKHVRSIVTYLAVSLFLCSSGSNVRGESRALEGYRDSSKSPSTVQNGEELLGGTEERGKKFSRRGVIDLPTRQINIFFLSGLTDI